MATAIQWTDVTWNPTTGCDRVSPGCDHCYALTLAKRLKAMGSTKYQRDGDPRTSGPRPGPWGNPFVVGRRLLVEQYPEGSKDGFGCSLLVTPEIAVALFREWSLCRQENVQEIRATLAGFDLACWCKLGEPCHADVLLEIANGGES